MKTLEFWQQKYYNAESLYRSHESTLVGMQFALAYYSRKLKKISGHGLNNNYDGYKVYKRRRNWLKNRVTLLTKMAYHRKEMERIERTKLSFFKSKIDKMQA